MTPRATTPAVLALPLLLPFVLPFPARAQLSSITIEDVARAVKVGRVTRDVIDILNTGKGVKGKVPSAAKGRAVIATGGEYLGVPYVWGGSTPRGFDCSGFVQYVYRENGIPLPRTSRQMAHAGTAVAPNLSSLKEGDLMLFRGKDGVINHVALYAGNDRILQSSSSGGGVRFDELWGDRGAYYRSHLVAARRVTNGTSIAWKEAIERIMREFPFDHYDLPDDAPRPSR